MKIHVELNLRLPSLRKLKKRLGLIPQHHWLASERGFEELQALVTLNHVLANPALHLLRYGTGDHPVAQAINRAYDDELLSETLEKMRQAFQRRILGLEA